MVAAAHRDAVEVALAFLEERAALARVQSGGVRHRVGTGGWVVAGFVHRTSREGDPQFHTHCLVPNLVQRTGDGRHVALDAGPLFDWARAAGSVYQNQLQRALTTKLGVRWGPDRHNTREMEGFSKAQLRAFSKRSAQIEAELEAKGATYESPALRMRADDEASLATRTAKDRSLTPSLLAGRWQREAAQVGLATGADLDRALCSDRSQSLEAPGWDEVTAALVDPETGLCSRSARFTQADVVEHLCALSAGRLALEEVVVMADRFVGSDLAVRLTPDVEAGRARPAQWSTAAHRALEDRTLALMATLAARPSAAIAASATEAALGDAPGLGEDQVAAVRVLAGEGGSLRAVLAPAGYGKTTMLHTAARAAAADGRPVVAVATTAKAVAELAGAGLDAKTIARLRIDLSNGPLAAGTVVVLDEISQTPTDQVEAVLAAVDACPGGSLWVLGDPRQSQPVGAGRRRRPHRSLGQRRGHRLGPAHRQPPPGRPRRPGGAWACCAGVTRRRPSSLRSEQGWEHEHASPAEARQAMAGAVCDDIAKYGRRAGGGAGGVPYRRRGPGRPGPGQPERYRGAERAGSGRAGVGRRAGVPGRRPGPAARPLRPPRQPAGQRHHGHGHRGPAAMGLTVRLDSDKGAEVLLPAAFVAGARKDGAPNLSHAWARTVDGAQGGTWEACHLLGSSALDAYRGYTGQSRSRQPTHTWNTARVVADHGGALADQRDGAEQVADALSRQPDPSMAARSDPWVVDRQLRELIAEHERALSARPPDRQDALAAAVDEMRSASAWLENMDAVAAHSRRELDRLGRVGRVEPPRPGAATVPP